MVMIDAWFGWWSVWIFTVIIFFSSSLFTMCSLGKFHSIQVINTIQSGHQHQSPGLFYASSAAGDVKGFWLIQDVMSCQALLGVTAQSFTLLVRYVWQHIIIFIIIIIIINMHPSNDIHAFTYIHYYYYFPFYEWIIVIVLYCIADSMNWVNFHLCWSSLMPYTTSLLPLSSSFMRWSCWHAHQCATIRTIQSNTPIGSCIGQYGWRCLSYPY